VSGNIYGSDANADDCSASRENDDDDDERRKRLKTVTSVV